MWPAERKRVQLALLYRYRGAFDALTRALSSRGAFFGDSTGTGDSTTKMDYVPGLNKGSVDPASLYDLRPTEVSPPPLAEDVDSAPPLAEDVDSAPPLAEDSDSAPPLAEHSPPLTPRSPAPATPVLVTIPSVGSPSAPPPLRAQTLTLTCDDTSVEAMLLEHVALMLYRAHGVPSAVSRLDVDVRGKHTLTIDVAYDSADLDDLSTMSRQVARIIHLSDWLQEPSAIGDDPSPAAPSPAPASFANVCVSASHTGAIVKCRAPLAFRPRAVWSEYDVVRSFNRVAEARRAVEQTSRGDEADVAARAAALETLREWNDYVGLTNFGAAERLWVIDAMRTGFRLARALDDANLPIVASAAPAAAPLDYATRRRRAEGVVGSSDASVVEARVRKAAQARASFELRRKYEEVIDRFNLERPGVLVGDAATQRRKLRLQIVQDDGGGDDVMRSIMRDAYDLDVKERNLALTIARHADRAYATMLRAFRTYFWKRREAFAKDGRGRCEAHDDDVKWFEAIGIGHEEAVTLVHEKRMRMSNISETMIERLCPDAQCSPTASDLLLRRVFGREPLV